MRQPRDRDHGEARFRPRPRPAVVHEDDAEDEDGGEKAGGGPQGEAVGSPAAEEEAPAPAEVPGPLGVWSEAELRSLPRFPHRESFSMAKGLINSFLFQEQEDGPSYRDVQIALFWLGFGLLDMPTAEQPTLGLVPLCKDLDLYADIAEELGYDPAYSVHGQPVCSAAGAAGSRVPGCGWQQQQQQHKMKSRAPLTTTAGVVAGAGRSSVGPAGTSSSSGSSSSTGGAGSSTGPASTSRGGAPGEVGSWPPALKGSAADDEDHDSNEDPSGSCGGPSAYCGAGSQQVGIFFGSAAASSCCEQPGDLRDGRGRTDGRFGAGAEDSEVPAYKVKLLHAGGWSSSSSSDGQSTPPTPQGNSGSSASVRGAADQQGDRGTGDGGLGADHIEQFTVSFVSDLSLHEDLEETSLLCTFCLDEMQIGDEICRLPCMHTFHRCCVHAWLARDRRCMLCRLDVTRPGG